MPVNPCNNGCKHKHCCGLYQNDPLMGEVFELMLQKVLEKEKEPEDERKPAAAEA